MDRPEPAADRSADPTVGQPGALPESPGLPPPEVLRALADPSRRSLYHRLRRSGVPLTTSELAGQAGLHPNTVRAHLDQLAAAGLVQVDAAPTGGRGRPRHRFIAAASPPLSPDRGLARSLVEVVQAAGGVPEVVRNVGRRSGRAAALAAGAPSGGPGAVRALAEHETAAGFDATVDRLAAGRWRLSFAACPYAELATSAPEVVCLLHQGSVEGQCLGAGCLELESFDPSYGAAGCCAVLVEVARG